MSVQLIKEVAVTLSDKRGTLMFSCIMYLLRDDHTHMYCPEEDCESVAALTLIVFALPVNVTSIGTYKCYIQILIYGGMCRYGNIRVHSWGQVEQV